MHACRLIQTLEYRYQYYVWVDVSFITITVDHLSPKKTIARKSPISNKTRKTNQHRNIIVFLLFLWRYQCTHWRHNLSSITMAVSRSTYYLVFKYSLRDVRWGPYNPGMAGHPSPVTCKEFIEEEGLLRVKGSFASCRGEARNGTEGWEPVEREERSDSSGTISSRSHRTSCHPRPYISWLVLPPSQGPAAPYTTLIPFLHVLLGPPRSCDPRRGKLSTLAPCERPSSVTSDICELFDRQTALFPSQIHPYCTSFPPSLPGALSTVVPSTIASRATRRVCHPSYKVENVFNEKRARLFSLRGKLSDAPACGKTVIDGDLDY